MGRRGMKRACAVLAKILTRLQPAYVCSYLGHSALWGVALAVLS